VTRWRGVSDADVEHVSSVRFEVLRVALVGCCSAVELELGLGLGLRGIVGVKYAERLSFKELGAAAAVGLLWFTVGDAGRNSLGSAGGCGVCSRGAKIWLSDGRWGSETVGDSGMV